MKSERNFRPEASDVDRPIVPMRKIATNVTVTAVIVTSRGVVAAVDHRRYRQDADPDPLGRSDEAVRPRMVSAIGMDLRWRSSVRKSAI